MITPNWRRSLLIRPRATGTRAREDAFNEFQPPQAVLYTRVVPHWTVSAPNPGHILREAAIDVRKGLEVSFRMTRGRSRHRRGGFAHVTSARAQVPPRLIRRLEDQGVRFLLVPLQPGRRPVEPDRQAVSLAAGDLGAHQGALRSAAEPHENVRVVIEHPAVDEAGHIGAQGTDRLPGDEGEKILGVRADISHAATRARARGLGAPSRLFVAGAFDRLHQPILKILDVDAAEFSQLSRLHQRARLAYRRIPRVDVGNGE